MPSDRWRRKYEVFVPKVIYSRASSPSLIIRTTIIQRFEAFRSPIHGFLESRLQRRFVDITSILLNTNLLETEISSISLNFVS